MPAIFKYKIQVTEQSIDENNHVNNIEYIKWMQNIAINHSQVQIDPAVLKNYQATWVARSHHIDYIFPSFLGDEIEISTWIADTGKVRAIRRYRFLNLNSNKLLARAETHWVFIDFNTGRPKPIPDEILNAYIVVSPADEPK